MSSSRRLQSIYDALDAHNYRHALKLVRASEAKIGSSDVLVALRCVALQRLGRVDECAEACEEFVSLNSGDPAVLEAMQRVFKSVQRLDLNTKVYEHAVALKKGNELLTIGLYFAYLRQHNFLRQQQVAMSLYRTFGREKYLRWAVLNMELQHHEAVAKEGADVSPRIIQLADMMLSKHKGVVEFRHGTMHIRVLIILQHHEKIVQLLEGPFGELWKEKELVEMQLSLAAAYAGLGKLEEGRDIYVSLLESCNPDDWRCLTGYVDTQTKRCRAPDADASAIVVDTRAFLRKLQSCGRLRRGPFLAEIELERRLASTVDESLTVPRLVQAYFTQFGSYPCFFSDVRRYLPLCDSGILDDMCPDESKPQSLVSVELLRRFFGVVPSEVADLEAYAAELYTKFRSVALVSTSSESTDAHPAEDLLVIVVHTLIDLFALTQQARYLHDAVCALEDALTVCPSKFQYRFLLIRLYCHPCLSAIQCSLKHFIALEVKQVQLDTMSGLVMDDCMRYAAFDKATALAEDIVDFHSSHAADAPDFVTLAYREDNLDQVLDFEAFTRRLTRSKRLLLARVSLGLAGYVACAKSIDHMRELVQHQLEETPGISDDLVCNDDENLIVVADSPERPRRFQEMNRPAAFFVANSWSVDRGDVGKLQHGLDSARFHRVVLQTTLAMLERQPQVLRGHFQSLRDLLVSHKVVAQDSSFSLESSVIPTDSVVDLEQRQWDFSFHCLETSACVSEAYVATLAFIESLPQLSVERIASGIEENTLRWSALQSQFQLQLSLFEHIVTDFNGRLLSGLGVSSAPYLPIMSCFVNFGACWATLSCEVWAQQVPSKRAYLKHRKTLAIDSLDTPVESVLSAEDDVLKAILATRAVLRSVVTKMSTALLQLTTKLSQCIGAEREVTGLSAKSDASCLQGLGVELKLGVHHAIVQSRESTCQSVLTSLKRVHATLSNMKF